jgi:ADP-dependent NAD(P)H-hydrate dehydratase / NAD(P)H-hydrate epimerase
MESANFVPARTSLAPRLARRHDRGMIDLSHRPELLTPAQMSAADKFAIACGIPGIDLMERAGAAVADEAGRMARTRGRIRVLCGPGGNGGDGFIAARMLAERGYRVELFLLGDRAALRGDPALAAERFRGVASPAEAFDPEGADLVIDALYGAGLSRDVDGIARERIERINAFAGGGGAVLGVDVPSGIDGETGAARGAAVRASASVTFFRLKPGHLLLPGRDHAGRLVLADIGIRADALAMIGPRTHANAPPIWLGAWPAIGASEHKYTRGAALVLSGPAHRTGAARLAARAALRVGAGLVTLASPPGTVAVNAMHSTAVMIEPFEGLVGFAALLADPRRNAILLGPGAGLGAATRALVEAALSGPSDRSRAVVLDADALGSFAGDSASLGELIGGQGRATILTPHEGEFARLFRGRADILGAPSKLARARAAAAVLGAVVVLKGADTVVAAPDGRASIGCDLPPTLATAGAGDVLAGLACGLLAQGMPAFEAASAAVWVHGACARALGPGLIAEDLAEALPGVLRALLQST